MKRQRVKSLHYLSMENDNTITYYSFQQNQKVPAPISYSTSDIHTVIGLGPALTPKILLDFIDNEGNIMLALSSETPVTSTISSLLLEFDISLPSDKNTVTVDHFNYDIGSAAEQHDVLVLPRPTFSRKDIKNFFGGDGVVAFPRSVAQTLGNSSPLLNPILRGKSTTYTYNPKEEKETSEEPFAVGQQISLVSALQARNSARFTVFGSLEALEDKWFDSSVQIPSGKKVKTVNRDFAKQVSQWAFKETGVLKIQSTQHYLTEHTEQARNNSIDQVKNLNPKIYRVKNDVVCLIFFSSLIELN
jgi:oligosaccharyltransferase complex subunit beta